MTTQSTGLLARLAQGSLVKQILIGLVLGILLGLVSKPAAIATGLLGTLFVGALKAVAPVLVLMLGAGPMTVAAPLQSETMAGVAIVATGTPITFARTYREPPAVQVTPGAGATGGVASNITTTGATIQLFSGSTAVAGTASLTVTGV